MDRDEIQRQFAELFGEALSQEKVDEVIAYNAAQREGAQELYQSAVADGLNFATTDETGDVYVNVKWIGMIVKTVAASLVLDGEPAPSTLRLAEVLHQTVDAAGMFVGK